MRQRTGDENLFFLIHGLFTLRADVKLRHVATGVRNSYNSYKRYFVVVFEANCVKLLIMSKTTVMTLRVAPEVRRGLERLAARSGHKPAQIGARLVEEGLRRREFPEIDLRETAAGRVAYLRGTRLAVHWLVQRVRSGMRIEEVAQGLDLSPAQINAALAYARAYAREIERDIEEAEANRKWLELQDSARHEAHSTTRARKGRHAK